MADTRAKSIGIMCGTLTFIVISTAAVGVDSHAATVPVANICCSTSVTSSREWTLQGASAMVIIAFTTNAWIAEQRFIQHGALNQSAHISNATSTMSL
jgi:hypothetical protein